MGPGHGPCVGHFPEAGPIDDRDLLARERDEARGGKTLEQSADDFANTAKLFGQGLVGALDGVAAGKQQLGESLVEAAEGDLLDELHQLGDALGEEPKDEVPERAAVGDQLLEYGDWQEQQRERRLGDAARGIRAVGEQAARGDDARIAWRHSVEEHLASASRTLHHLDRASEDQGESLACLPFGKQLAAGWNLQLCRRLAECRQLLRRQGAQHRIDQKQRLPQIFRGLGQSLNSALTGAWSDGRSSLRISRLMPAAVQRLASGEERRMWSMRSPRFLWKPSMR
mgnify:CR=1 FL=1